MRRMREHAFKEVVSYVGDPAGKQLISRQPKSLKYSGSWRGSHPDELGRGRESSCRFHEHGSCRSQAGKVLEQPWP